jgi:hypothetical protein
MIFNTAFKPSVTRKLRVEFICGEGKQRKAFQIILMKGYISKSCA